MPPEQRVAVGAGRKAALERHVPDRSRLGELERVVIAAAFAKLVDLGLEVQPRRLAEPGDIDGAELQTEAKCTDGIGQASHRGSEVGFEDDHALRTRPFQELVHLDRLGV